MKAGDYIKVKGKKQDWLDKQNGTTHPDYRAIVIEMRSPESLYNCCIMKSDGSLWNVKEEQCQQIRRG